VFEYFGGLFMKTIIDILSDKLSAAFMNCGYLGKLGCVTISDRPDLCQFQCNGAFAGAKLYKKSPALIANEIVRELNNEEIIKSINVEGTGFINIDISDDFILSYVQNILDDEFLGIPQSENQEVIFLDYGGPNVAKPLHIGHLRSAIIGESLKQIVKATGRKTISDVHLGDWGLQIGLVIAELEERYCRISDDILITADELNEIYPYASKKSKEDKDFKVKAQNITAELQKGNPTYLALWKEITKISTNDIKSNYKLLNVDFDLWYGESDAQKYVDNLVELLNNKHLLEKSMGAMVVNVSQEDDKTVIPPVIIKKSDDSNIYATTDLATIIQRQKDFSPDEIWYIVDSRQSLHFTQVFRCAKKANIVSNGTKLLHLGFGTMNGDDGKPYKTRDGGVMKLYDFYNVVYKAVYERVISSTYSENDRKEDISQKISLAAIKFGDLINHRMKDYIFDLDKFIASEGKTGTFLLYTVARINSILKKASYGNKIAFDKVIYTDIERELLIRLALNGEVFIKAYNEKAPNIICENAYQIASLFSKFYTENHIIDESDYNKKIAWLNICVATKTILLKHFEVIGFEAVELM